MASVKSFHSKDDTDGPGSGQGFNPEVDFRGQERKNETHTFTTDPDARLYKKTKAQTVKLCYIGHALMGNRNGQVVDTWGTVADDTAESPGSRAGFWRQH